MSTEHSHHHHHHHHHNDDTSRYRAAMQKNLKMRKLIPKIIWTLGCILAVLCVCVMVLAYSSYGN